MWENTYLTRPPSSAHSGVAWCAGKQRKFREEGGLRGVVKGLVGAKFVGAGGARSYKKLAYAKFFAAKSQLIRFQMDSRYLGRALR